MFSVTILLGGFAVALLAYLLGSLSFAVIVTKLLYHKDIRTFGSGNAGMTNVLRTFGKGAAALTLIGDMGKGILAVVLGKWIFAAMAGTPEAAIYGGCIACLCVVLGHIFPVFFGFKGGKAISVGAGSALGLHPLLLIPVLAIFLIVFFCSRMVSLASVCAAVFYPIGGFLVFYFVVKSGALPVTLTTAAVAVLAIWKHRGNIHRIAQGTEYKFSKKKAAQPEQTQGKL